jgi:TM2 domain-containing membrane protein YozV
MAQIFQILPELSGNEQAAIQNLIKDMGDDQAQQFAAAYRARRRDPMVILLTTLLVFVGFAGINRFLLGQIGMGLLYLLTGGLCLIGSIIDMINYQNMTVAYNLQEARQIMQTMNA